MANLIPPRRGEFLTKEGQPTQRFIEYLESISSFVNTNSATVDSVDVSTAYKVVSHAVVDSNRFNVSVAADYTATGYESVLIVTGAATITLNPTPDDGEQVSIKRATTAGNVVVSGTIDGASQYTIAENYECIDLIYIVSSDEWLIV